MMRRIYSEISDNIFPAVLNSYSVIFFFNNRLIALILLTVTLFNIIAGLCGLIAVLTAVLIARLMGFDKNLLRQGIYSFNALLTGIAIGTFFEPGAVFFVILLLAVLFSLIISVVMGGWLGKYGLPFLSIPFIFSFWIIHLPAGQLANLGLTQRNVFWMNEMYAIGGKHLLDFFQTVESLPINKMVTIYFRSLSSIFFQDNIAAGILIAIALIAGSRIAFLLSVTGFFTSYLFARFVGADMVSFSFYNVGANYILVAIAVGGFFTIPSRSSFLWSVVLVPLTSLLILFLNRLLTPLQLPVFSLPFSLITILFLWFLILRVKPGWTVLTSLQQFSPEVNLYSYKNNLSRLSSGRYFPFSLPFWGEWTVYQGYDGKHTHKGEWSSAIDFVLTDESKKSWDNSGNQVQDFYCYNKPVVSPGDGIVADIIDNVDDNEPGKVNTLQNWGNTIVLRHNTNLYSQVSHLKAGSFKVKKGDFVNRGDLVALCGNSGRSPEPHIHFQIQATPAPGAKTSNYPLSYYLLKKESGHVLKTFSVPAEGDIISNISACGLLRSAFDFQPGMVMRFRYSINSSEEKSEEWEVMTDAWNYKYLYCSETGSIAYFVDDGTMFSFTSFVGKRKSLLYFFYLTAYKTMLGYYPDIETEDYFPLHIVSRNNPLLWLHDFIAPFYQLIKVKYAARQVWSDLPVNPSAITIDTRISISSISRIKSSATGGMILEKEKIREFSLNTGKLKVWAKRSDI
jgi:urea transporter/murein DD-endopeptidase MepM/ murein hydrolase activator NlpD